MSPWRDYIYMLLGGLALAVLAPVVLMYGNDWRALLSGIMMCIAAPLLLFATAYCLYRDWKNGTLFPKILRPRERKQGIELALELPWSTLSARFHELEQGDDTIVANDPPGFLSWNEGATIHLHHTEGEDWLALYWVNVDNYLRDAELAALCRRHKLPMADDYRKKKATGVAFCHAGKLTLYPAAFEPEFRDHFLTRVLAPEASFRQWAATFYDGGGEEA